MGSREGAKGKGGNIQSAGGGGGNIQSAGGGGGTTVAEMAKQPQFTGHLNLTHDQTRSVLAYQEGSSSHLNRVHRKQTKMPLSPTDERTSHHLDMAIANSRINRPTLMRRAFRSDVKMRPGMTFDDGGFGSFSVKREVTRRFINKGVTGEHSYVLRVRAAPGTTGLYVQGVPGASYHHTHVVPEHEVLRGRGSAYKVRRVRKIKSGPLKGVIVLDADIIV